MSDQDGILACDSNGHPLQKAVRVSTIDGTGVVTALTGVIASSADGGGGTTVDMTDVAHGLVSNQFVTIAGTTDYNGTFQVTVIDADTFTITDTWVDDQSGTWTLNANQSPVTVDTTEVVITIPSYCVEVLITTDEDIWVDGATGVSATQGFKILASTTIPIQVKTGEKLYFVRDSATATVAILYQLIEAV